MVNTFRVLFTDDDVWKYIYQIKRETGYKFKYTWKSTCCLKSSDLKFIYLGNHSWYCEETNETTENVDRGEVLLRTEHTDSVLLHT